MRDCESLSHHGASKSVNNMYDWGIQDVVFGLQHQCAQYQIVLVLFSVYVAILKL